jgi:hypothetical protein
MNVLLLKDNIVVQLADFNTDIDETSSWQET